MLNCQHIYIEHLLQTRHYAMCWKHSDPHGALRTFVDMTYFIKSKSPLIKDIIILCSIQREKKFYHLNHDTVFPYALEILFSNY